MTRCIKDSQGRRGDPLNNQAVIRPPQEGAAPKNIENAKTSSLDEQLA